MRKILITIRLVLISLLANASYESQLCLTSSDHKLFSVSIDQSRFSSPGRFVTINGLEPGYHFVNIIGYSRLSYGPPKAQVLFEEYVYIPASSKINACVGSNQTLRFTSETPFYSNCIPVNPNFNYNQFANAGPLAMCESEFTQLQNTIASKSFDSSKLQIALQAVRSNHFTARQIAELMEQMSFESSRLELAKAAFNHTIDRQNYYKVNASFSFESSIDELNQFIRNNS